MNPAYLYLLIFVLASALLWHLARTGRAAWSGLGLAWLVFALGALTSLALTTVAVGLAWAAPVLAWLYDPLVALGRRLFHGLGPLDMAQIMVLLGVLALRLVFVILVCLGSLLRRVWRTLRPQPPAAEAEQGPRHRASAGLATALRVTLVGTGVVLGTLPFWDGTGVLPLEVMAAFVWIGYWLLLIEAAGRAEPGPTAGGATEIAGEDAQASAEHQLERLYRLYIARHRPMLFACRRRLGTPRPNPALQAPAASPPGGGSTAALLRVRWGQRLSPNLLERLALAAAAVDDGRDLLLGESLCSHHFVLIAALIQDSIDRGRSVLVLCPEASLEEVQASLALHAEPNLRRLTPDWAVLGRTDLAADADPDVLLCPDSELERSLPLGSDPARRTWGRLGLIVALDIQALNVPLARFVLARVHQLGAAGGAVRLVMQAAHADGVETLARALHSPARLTEVRVSAWLETNRYLLVWDRDHEPLAEHRARYFPGLQEYVAPEWLLLLPPWELGLTVTRFDPGNRHDEDAFERLRAHLPRYGHDDKVAVAAAHRPIGHGCVGAGAAVGLLDDPGNLLLALDHDGGSSGLHASLINILCGNYLLRDYLRACLAVAEPRDLPRGLRPLAAEPLGNPYTLAYALSRAFAGSTALTAAELNDQFLDPSPSRVRAALGLRASRRGLTRLFERVFGAGSVTVSVHRRPDGRAVYTLTPNRPLLRAAYLDAVNAQGDALGRLLASDHGLTYASGQTLLFAHKFHRVARVGADRVELMHVETAGRDSRERHVFHRRYRLPAAGPDNPVCPGEPWRQELGGGLVMTLTFTLRTLERETLGYLTLAESMRPLARGGAEYGYTPCEPPIARTYPYQSVTQLGIEGIAPLIQGDDQADRRTRLAFTLCALLHDAMVSLFPDQQARIAVVSPQARPVMTALDPGPPTGAGPREPGPSVPTDGETARLLERLYPTLAAESSDQPGPGQGDLNDAALGRIDISIIEDSAFDLGVARALGEHGKLDHLLRLVRQYLHWALEQPPAGLYHSLGAPGLAPAFDYPTARALLDRLLPVAEEPPTGPLDTGCAESGETLTETLTEALTETVPVCDFCAAPLAATYDRLDDGRCRCADCTAQAIDTTDEFRRVFREVVEQMEGDYGIALRRDLGVRFVNAERLAASVGEAFVPTPALDPRTVGLAVRNPDGSAEILLENGSPYLMTAATLAHELTHLWQFDRKVDLSQVPQETIEGQARFIEIDYLRRHGGRPLAEAIARAARDGADVYSRGYRQVEAVCGGSDGRVFACFERQLRGEQ
jgi:hypothetical protein